MMINTDHSMTAAVLVSRALEPAPQTSAAYVNCGLSEPAVPGRFIAVTTQTQWTEFARTGPPLPSEHA